MRQKTRTGTRTEYINEHAKDNYDKFNLLLPKGMKSQIKEVASNLEMSVSEYIQFLIKADIGEGGSSRTLAQKEKFSEEQVTLMEKWQIPKKYYEMIDSVSVSKDLGYCIFLKIGYINDITGNRTIQANKANEIRKLMPHTHGI